MVSPFFEGLGSSWAFPCPRRPPRCALPMRFSPRWRSIRASRREMDIPCRIAVAPWIGEATVVRSGSQKGCQAVAKPPGLMISWGIILPFIY